MTQHPNETKLMGIFGDKFEFWLQSILFNGILSVLGTIFNFLLFCIVVRKLQRDGEQTSRFYVLLAVRSLLKTLACLWTLVFGFYQQIGHFRPQVLALDQHLCLSLFQPLIFCELMFPILLLLISIDRYLIVVTNATSWPGWFTVQKMARILCFLAIITSTFMFVVYSMENSAERDEKPLVVPCTFAIWVSGPRITPILVAFSNLIGLASVILYFIMIVSLETLLILNSVRQSMISVGTEKSWWLEQ